ncbi:MAG TPA: DMT family transporter [Burkholderiaceae bacterium]|jgi:drug/metabolite transporter (DMT)-like permease|nr:DMT family transporter [Burkholderiaceae bacterium]
MGMVVVTLLWSCAGVVSRQLQSAESLEVTFFRSAFNFIALAIALTAMRGVGLWKALPRLPGLVWVSGVCWSVMFTAFMSALVMTRVANVLVTMAIGPLLTALLARLVLQHRLPPRTWIAIVVAGAGIAWMFGNGVQAADSRSLVGMAIALAVPLASSVNYTVLHKAGHAASEGGGRGSSHDAAGGTVLPAAGAMTEPQDTQPDMLVAVLIGAALSALVALPFAWPFHASGRDLAWLAGLGVFQLAIPCLLLVRLTRLLPSAEISLLGLLETIFGVLWAWLGAGEQPGAAALVGGALVIGALAGNELLSLRPSAVSHARVLP